MENLLLVGGRTHINPSEINFMEASSNYTIIHKHNGEKLMVATTLKTIEERFGGCNFIRIHRSYLINRDYVKSVKNNVVLLKNNIKVILPRRKRDALHALYFQTA